MIGTRIGGYRLIRELGAGGMGSVYEGLREDIGRRVAVKVLLPKHSADPVTASRFFQEARAVSIIDHPGIASVFEFGHTDEKLAYLVMEYLDGETLRARLRPDRPPLGAVSLSLISQMAQALSATHAKQIVHRDLKPDNIMLIADTLVAGGLRAKLLDFGIAKMQNLSETDAKSVKTRTGSLVGTPTYMSPEQCRSNPDLDGQADMYALGVIFYEMLTGVPPFVSSALGELMAMHLYAPPAPVRAVVPGIPAELDSLVMRLLAKQPQERPTALDLVVELTRIQVTDTQLQRIQLQPGQKTPVPSFTWSQSGDGRSLNPSADDKSLGPSAARERPPELARTRRRLILGTQLAALGLILVGGAVLLRARLGTPPIDPPRPGASLVSGPSAPVTSPASTPPVPEAAPSTPATNPTPGVPSTVAASSVSNLEQSLRDALEQQQAAKVLRRLKTELKEHPSEAWLHELSCAAQLQLGKHAAAIKSCEQALSIAPGRASAQSLLSEARKRRPASSNTQPTKKPTSGSADASVPPKKRPSQSGAYDVEYLQ